MLVDAASDVIAVVSGIGAALKAGAKLIAKKGLKKGIQHIVGQGLKRLQKALRKGGCFVAGTLVVTQNGLLSIEDIREGDYVLSMPDDGDESAEPVWRRVEAAYERSTAIIDLAIEAPDGTTAMIGTTHEHPFWIGGRGWTRAEDIRPDDYVWSVERGWLWVRSVHERPEEEPVYNVRVADDHTYFVSERLGAQSR